MLACVGNGEIDAMDTIDTNGRGIDLRYAGRLSM